MKPNVNLKFKIIKPTKYNKISNHKVINTNNIKRREIKHMSKTEEYKELQGKGSFLKTSAIMDEFSAGYLYELRKFYDGLGLKVSTSVIFRRAIEVLYCLEKRTMKRAIKNGKVEEAACKTKGMMKMAAGKSEFTFDKPVTEDELEKVLTELNIAKPWTNK